MRLVCNIHKKVNAIYLLANETNKIAQTRYRGIAEDGPYICDCVGMHELRFGLVSKVNINTLT